MQWVNANDRSPDESGPHLIVHRDYGGRRLCIEIAVWTFCGWETADAQMLRATHWMPLPELPRGDAD